MTAAAGQKKDGNDDDPNAVVVKKIAEAVVHNGSSLILRADRKRKYALKGSSATIVCRCVPNVHAICRKKGRKKRRIRENRCFFTGRYENAKKINVFYRLLFFDVLQ